MDWIDTRIQMPEDGKEVLCAITKTGMRTIDPSYHTPSIDKDMIRLYHGF